MDMRLRLVLPMLLLLLTTALDTSGGPGSVRRGATKALTQEVCERISRALDAPDEATRTESVRAILEVHYLELGRNARIPVDALISRHQHLIDPSAFEKISRRCRAQQPERNSTGCMTRILDFNQLDKLPRADKIEVLRNAISIGKAELWRGSELGRSQAVISAVGEGLFELERTVIDTWSELDERQRESMPLDGVQVAFELRGDPDGNEVHELAARRLMEMPAEEVARRMEHDPGFRWAVFDTASSACETRYQSVMHPTACELLKALGKRQNEHVERLGIPKQQSGERPSMYCTGATWWDCLESFGEHEVLVRRHR